MLPHFRRLTVAAVCLAALLPVAACTDDSESGKSSDSSKAQSEQTEQSLFDQRSVAVAVKKGQPGFNTRSGEEYEYAGFETDLLNSLSEDVPFKAYPRDIPSLDREKILLDEAADLVIATYTITDGRDEDIDFTAPYLKTYQGVLVEKDETEIKKLDDLKEKRVCSAFGSTSDPGSEKEAEAKKSISKTLGEGVKSGFRKDYKTCVKELIEGNFDAVWTDKIVLEGFAHADPYRKHVKMAEGITVEKQQYYGIGLREGHDADCRKLNAALKKFLRTGWVTAFRQHFPHLANGDFEQRYKPSNSDFERHERTSCGAS